VVSTERWIVTFDNFMNASETDALIAAVGAESGGPGFVRSTDTGNVEARGPFLASRFVKREKVQVMCPTKRLFRRL